MDARGELIPTSCTPIQGTDSSKDGILTSGPISVENVRLGSLALPESPNVTTPSDLSSTPTPDMSLTPIAEALQNS